MIKTTTQLTINQKAISVSKYTWTDDIYFELDNGDGVRIGCDDDTFITAFTRFITQPVPYNESFDKLPESTRKSLKMTMARLYDYFNQDDAS